MVRICQNIIIGHKHTYLIIIVHRKRFLDYFSVFTGLPVVPHKAVAEVSKIGDCRRGWLL